MSLTTRGVDQVSDTPTLTSSTFLVFLAVGRQQIGALLPPADVEYGSVIYLNNL